MPRMVKHYFRRPVATYQNTRNYSNVNESLQRRMVRLEIIVNTMRMQQGDEIQRHGLVLQSSLILVRPGAWLACGLHRWPLGTHRS